MVRLTSLVASAALLALVLAGTTPAEDKQPLKSGPQVSEELAGPFHVLNINGPTAGQKQCLYCRNGENPVAMVFAREVTPETTKLIKKLDACTMKNKDAHMGSFVVFCSDADGLEQQLKDMVAKENLKEIVLSIDQPAGPKGYKVAKDADVTVVLYTDKVVKANYAFKKGELKDQDIDAVVKDVARILPAK